MRKYLAVLMFCSLAFLPACAQIGVPTADTFNERLAVGYTTVTAVRATSTKLLQAKKLSPDDDSNVQSAADNARTGLDVARAISKSDLSAASNKLTAVSTALSAIQSYLASKGN